MTRAGLDVRSLCGGAIALAWGLFTASLAAAQATSGADQQSIPPRLPDFSAYDCARVNAAAGETRHMGQVINGRYNEWFASYVGVGAAQRLACISLLKPDTRQLSTDEARAFLTESFNIGAPVPPKAAAQNRPQSAQEEDVSEPANVRPEPRKRLRTPQPGTPETSASRSGAPEPPPLPDSRGANDPPQAVTPRIPRPAASTFETPAAVGIEDRVPVASTTTYPWNTIGYLSVTYPNGESYRCSGTLVSPYVVLTAGHCIHNLNRGGYASQARFYPGQYGTNAPVRPYGGKSDYAFLKTTTQWAQISGEESYPVTDYRHDFAAIQFRTPFTFTGTFMPVMYGSVGTPVISAGYPATVGGISTLGQFMDTDTETSQSLSLRNSHIREFRVDASGGNSGGAFFYTDPATGQRVLVGSLSYGADADDRAGGPWYDSWNQALVSSWVSWTPNGPVASGSVNGLRAAGIFSTTQITSQSFLRFYNSSTAAGTVDVTLADYATGNILGTWTSPSIAAGSAPQFFIGAIETGANQVFTRPAFYSISVRPSFAGYFQHALWRQLDGTLTNLSTCDTAATTDARTLTNVHSSLLQAGYPSTIIVHNTGAANISVALGIYDARTGARLGTYVTGSVPANAQRIVTVATIEAVTGVQPSAGMFHYNIRSDAAFSGYLQHLVNNTVAGVTSDMSSVCRLSP